MPHHSYLYPKPVRYFLKAGLKLLLHLHGPLPEPLKIGFDSKLVLETLKAFTCENIAMNFSGPKMPAVVEAEDSDMKAIVFPVMIREE